MKKLFVFVDAEEGKIYFFDCSLKQFKQEPSKKYRNSTSTNEILLFYISKSIFAACLPSFAGKIYFSAE